MGKKKILTKAPDDQIFCIQEITFSVVLEDGLMKFETRSRKTRRERKNLN